MHHPLDICLNIAHQLKEPDVILGFFKNMTVSNALSPSEDLEFSLGFGITGVICFYGVMSRYFEDDGWDVVAHKYIKILMAHYESISYQDTSLFFGLTGFLFSVHLCSWNGSRYKNILSKIETVWKDEVHERYLFKIDHYLDPQIEVSPSYYNLSNGISGIIAYLLARNTPDPLTRLCVECLVKVLTAPKLIDGEAIDPWFLFPQSASHYNVDEFCKDGFCQMNIPDGIVGALGILSQAALQGINVNGLKELIAKLSHWIVDKAIISEDLIHWPPLIPRNFNQATRERNRENWKIGALGISRCLFLASKAIKDNELKNYSEEILITHLKRVCEPRNSPDTHLPPDNSFPMGKSGALSLAYQMGCDTEKPVYFKLAKEIEFDLARSYSPLNLFGFRSIDLRSEDKIELFDSPSLIQGAVGVALSLLQVQGKPTPRWHQVFLIS